MNYIKKLENAYMRGAETLKDTLKDLEEGEIFSRIGIRNFLEADYFAWYLDLWDEALAESVNGLARILADYESADVGNNGCCEHCCPGSNCQTY